MSDLLLPKELTTDILSRLPVPALLKLRSVSRSFRSLIDGHDFVLLHLSRSLSSPSNLSLILRRHEHLHSLHLATLNNYPQINNDVVIAKKIDYHPLFCQDYGTEVCGSSRGLVCLSNSLDTLAIWNPATRKSRKLPYASIEFKDLSRYIDLRVYGFGYNESSDDFKLVRIVILKNSEGDVFDNEVKVYSLRTDTWHRVEKFPRYGNNNLSLSVGVLASESIHWVVNEGRKGGIIVRFDLGSEVFNEVPQPDYTDKKFVIGLQNLDGFLSIACNYFSERVDVWVMKEYGVKDSWVKLVSIEQSASSSVGPFQYLKPIMYSKNGVELLFENGMGKLVWYDLKEKTMRHVKIRGIRDLLQVDVVVESLIPIDAVDSCLKKQKEKEEKNMDNFLSKGFKLVL